MNRLLREIWRRKLGKLAISLILILFLVAALGPLAVSYHYAEQNVGPALQGPTWQHYCGTDDLGRDQFSRILGALRNTTIVSLMAALFGGVLLAILLGIIAGYYGGKVDTAIMWTGAGLYSIPTLILVLLIAATVRPIYNDFIYGISEWAAKSGIADLLLIFGAISLFAWIGGARTIRAAVLQIKELSYIEAARSLGTSDRRIMFWHILPNLGGLVVHNICSVLGFAVFAEIAVSFFGFGIHAPHPSFGLMFSWAYRHFDMVVVHPYLIIIPGLVVVIWVLSFGLLRITATAIAESKYERI